MNILLVEDDLEKTRDIADALKVFPDAAVTHVVDTQSARKQFALHTFDILVLDLSVPVRLDSDVRRDGGAVLLSELCANEGKIAAPRCIVVVTAFKDLAAEFRATIRQAAAHVAHYDRANDDWKEVLCGSVARQYAIESSSDHSIIAYKTDAAIVTALRDPELKAVLRIPWSWREKELRGDPTRYYLGRAGELSVVAASASQMGLPYSSALAAKLVERWRPRYLIMTGIAAGVRGRTDLCDVVVAEQCWDWGDGKWIVREEELAFLPAPRQIAIDPNVRTQISALANDVDLLRSLTRDWPGKTPPGGSLRIGPFASGASVLADGKHMDAILNQHRQLLAVDMEAYGILAAARDAREKSPVSLIVKGIVDFGDGEKADDWQAFAAHRAAKVVEWFLNQVPRA